MKKSLIILGVLLFLAVAVFQFRRPLLALIPHPEPDPQVLVTFVAFGQGQVTPQSIKVIDSTGVEVTEPATHGYAVFQLKKQVHYQVVLTSLFQKATAGFLIPANASAGSDPAINASSYITEAPIVVRTPVTTQ
jgi:hypothetical protein